MGERVAILTGPGSTETALFAMAASGSSNRIERLALVAALFGPAPAGHLRSNLHCLFGR
jgi:hypothetical protein